MGEPDAVLVFDPSAFPKKGAESVGVQRQWCGRRGKIDNCQVGLYLAYASRREHALVDVRLYLHMKVRDGRVVYVFEHEDRAEALKAVGLEE